MAEELTFRFAEEADAGTILSFIKALAEYEKLADQVVATEELLREWIFQKGKAEVLFAVKDGREIDFPCSSITSPPSWVGRVSIWKTCSFSRSTGAGDMAAVFSASWPASRWSGAADGWSGTAWTGISPALPFTAPWGQYRWTSGPPTASQGTPWKDWPSRRTKPPCLLFWNRSGKL